MPLFDVRIASATIQMAFIFGKTTHGTAVPMQGMLHSILLENQKGGGDAIGIERWHSALEKDLTRPSPYCAVRACGVQLVADCGEAPHRSLVSFNRCQHRAGADVPFFQRAINAAGIQKPIA